jgi:hypothetical protein
VDEEVGRAVVGGDEAIALVGVEPLHCALSHSLLRLRRSSGPRARARAAATGCLRKPGSGIRAPLSELRRRCDTNTNFYYNQSQ